MNQTLSTLSQAPTNLAEGVPYFSFAQPGGMFYACCLRADSIVNLIDIRRRSEHPQDGIQRDDNRKRVSEIAAYASGEDAIFPTPIIISAKSDDFEFQNGTLKSKDATKSLGHVLDGQHRLLGIRETRREVQQRIQLLVVFAFDIDPYAEASIFATINGNQRQVPKSLMYDLFSLSPGRSPEKTCHEIVKSLNEDSSSPFFNRIKILGRKADDLETLSQAAFVDNVKGLIDGNHAPLRQLYLDEEDWAVRKIVANFFDALDDSIRKNKKDELLDSAFFYKTTGFGGTIKALRELALAGADAGDLSRAWLQPITDKFIADFTPPSGVGNSAMLDVKRQLLTAANSVKQLSLSFD